MIVPGALPDGRIVLVYGAELAGRDELDSTKPEGTGVPTTIVPDLSSDHRIVLVYSVALAGSREVAE